MFSTEDENSPPPGPINSTEVLDPDAQNPNGLDDNLQDNNIPLIPGGQESTNDLSNFDNNTNLITVNNALDLSTLIDFFNNRRGPFSNEQRNVFTQLFTNRPFFRGALMADTPPSELTSGTTTSTTTRFTEPVTPITQSTTTTTPVPNPLTNRLLNQLGINSLQFPLTTNSPSSITTQDTSTPASVTTQASVPIQSQATTTTTTTTTSSPLNLVSNTPNIIFNNQQQTSTTSLPEVLTPSQGPIRGGTQGVVNNQIGFQRPITTFRPRPQVTFQPNPFLLGEEQEQEQEQEFEQEFEQPEPGEFGEQEEFQNNFIPMSGHTPRVTDLLPFLQRNGISNPSQVSFLKLGLSM